MLHHPPITTLFPYTTLFRSQQCVSRRRPVWVFEPGVRAGAHHSARVRRPDEPGPVEPPVQLVAAVCERRGDARGDRKSTRLNSSHQIITYAVFCLKKKTNQR